MNFFSHPSSYNQHHNLHPICFTGSQNQSTYISYPSDCRNIIASMFFRTLALAAAVGSALAQRTSNTSICDYYTTALLKNNTAANQMTLLTLVVNTAVIGNCMSAPLHYLDHLLTRCRHSAKRRHQGPRYPRSRHDKQHCGQPPPLLQWRTGIVKHRRDDGCLRQLSRRRWSCSSHEEYASQ